MNKPTPRPDQATAAPQGFRDALAEFVQIGLRVGRMIGQVADAEAALAAAASQAGAEEGASALASSLAEAIEADRAAAAAAEGRQTVVARTAAVAAAFDRVSRSVRLTIALAERLDRGWARSGQADDRHAMTRRQIARGVADAFGRKLEAERVERLTGEFSERADAPDREDLLSGHSVEEVFTAVCRALGLDPIRMTVRSPLGGTISVAERGGAAQRKDGGSEREAHPPQRPPDG